MYRLSKNIYLYVALYESVYNTYRLTRKLGDLFFKLEIEQTKYTSISLKEELIALNYRIQYLFFTI